MRLVTPLSEYSLNESQSRQLVTNLAGFADRSDDHVVAVAAQLDVGTRSARQAPLGLRRGGRLAPSRRRMIVSSNTGVNQREV
jgi:hypothetical protein